MGAYRTFGFQLGTWNWVRIVAILTLASYLGIINHHLVHAASVAMCGMHDLLLILLIPC